MIEVDLGAGTPAEDYSDETLDQAYQALHVGNVKLHPSSNTAHVRSLHSSEVYRPAAQLDAEGNVIGVTCTCLNGKRGGVRARCYHAAALETLINERHAW